ncbi:MAG: ATP-binding cassette domain-containing protein, partial [Bacteroidia bacterium]|nr:ATP-binding cassette domain-containing protein [Bacteroidia bacterium]
MIQTHNISKSFGDRHVLKNVSFDLEPGKCNLIIGESGSGKTVFTKCMVGLLKVDSGEVL